MLIHIIDAPRKLRTTLESERYRVARGHWFPVVLALADLRSLGVTVAFHDDFSSGALDCDLACVASRHHDFVFKTEHSASERAASVARLAERCPIAWFDLRDSSGTTQFEVLPWVQCYVKQSLLRDRSLYRRDFYGGRIYTNYFHERFGIVDTRVVEIAENQETCFTTLHDVETPKLKLGWNISYGTFGLFRTEREEWEWIRACHADGTAGAPGLALAPPTSERQIRLAAMMSTKKYVRETLAFQRRRAMELLRSQESGDVATGTVPFDEYMRTLCNSRAALSCFGNGEICYRENEAWLSGAAVFMPDMSHLEAYPSLYRANETYIPLEWDLSDLGEKLEWVESRPDMFRDIAAGGQKKRAAMFSDDGIAAFAARFFDLLSSRESSVAAA
jgi:hypothetical protein